MAEDADGTGTGPVLADQDANGRALALAVRPEQAEQLALGEVQAEPVHGGKGAVPDNEVFQMDDRIHLPSVATIFGMVQKGVGARCAKHPPGRPGNGPRPLFEPCPIFAASGETNAMVWHWFLLYTQCMRQTASEERIVMLNADRCRVAIKAMLLTAVGFGTLGMGSRKRRAVRAGFR